MVAPVSCTKCDTHAGYVLHFDGPSYTKGYAECRGCGALYK
jgi:peptide methionine sulfoxide reductase MsrB